MLKENEESPNPSLSTMLRLSFASEDLNTLSPDSNEIKEKQQSILMAKLKFAQSLKRTLGSPEKETNPSNSFAFKTFRRIASTQSQPDSLDSPVKQGEPVYVDFDSAMNDFKEKLKARDLNQKTRSKAQQTCSMTHLSQEPITASTSKMSSLASLSLNRIPSITDDDTRNILSPGSFVMDQLEKESAQTMTEIRSILRNSNADLMLEPQNETMRRNQKSLSMKVVRFMIEEKTDESK